MKSQPYFKFYPCERGDGETRIHWQALQLSFLKDSQTWYIIAVMLAKKSRKLWIHRYFGIRSEILKINQLSGMISITKG